MLERFRRYSADTIGHADRITDRQSDFKIPPPTPVFIQGRGYNNITLPVPQWYVKTLPFDNNSNITSSPLTILSPYQSTNGVVELQSVLGTQERDVVTGALHEKLLRE